MQSPDADLKDELLALLPRLRVQALGLTRNRAAADDLVQDTIANALKALNSFTPGTNLAAWAHRILRNRFISDLRRRRDTIDIEEAPSAALAASGSHEDRLVLQELLQGFAGPRARKDIVERFTALPLLMPERQDHIDAAELRNRCRRAGVQLATIDALLAQLCIRHRLTLLTTDNDFLQAAAHSELQVWKADR